MSKMKVLTGSPQEVGEKLQENLDKVMDNTAKWAEILAFDPFPQTGLTPKETVWRKNKSKLYRYISPDGIKHRVPILFVYALINKAYILDLTPGMSMIESLVNRGFDVYMLEWGEFQWEDRNLGFGDLVFDYIAHAVRKVCQFSRIDELTMIGYCMGGTMTTMYASLFDTPKIKNMVLMAAPINFANSGIANLWISDPSFDVDKLVDVFKLVPKLFVDTGVKMLNPVNNFIGTYTRLWKLIDEGVSPHNWKVLNKWVNDNINFPGEAYRQWMRDIYQENKIVNRRFRIREQLVQLDKIDCPLLVMSGKNDHLVLPHQANAVLDLVSSADKRYKEFNIGHGGLVFGSIARSKVYPYLGNWLEERSS